MINKMKKRVAALILGGAMILAVALPASAAPQGSQENPLVTLSYLQDVFKAAILQEVQARIDSVRSGYETALSNQVAAYTQEMEQLVGDSDLGSAVFSVVELDKGDVLHCDIGGEVLLRAGAARSVSSLVNSTDGNTLAQGRALVQNHMYLALTAGQAVEATAAVTLLVRGDYTVVAAD